MYLTGFADEAADALSGQIRATKALGWKRIEARSVGGKNIHDIPEADFEKVCTELETAGVEVNCFGSTIANWGKKISEPFEDSLAAVDRAIPRMRRLGAKLVRIMSYAIELDAEGRALPDQAEAERFRRLREIVKRFTDAGITPVHENCMNYGGMSAGHTLRMLENVPGLKLVFDTGNPPLTKDFSKPFPHPMQKTWDFYQKVRDHIAYVHIKDTKWEAARKEELYFYPGEGDGEVERVLADLLGRGYDGGLSIEPHMAVVFHDTSVTSSEQARFDNYVEYGRRTMRMLERLGRPLEA